MHKECQTLNLLCEKSLIKRPSAAAGKFFYPAAREETPRNDAHSIRLFLRANNQDF